jgi:hypothetical protein
LWRSARKLRKEKNRNLKIREIMSKTTFLRKKRRLRWFGHLKRTGNGLILKMIMDWNFEGRRRNVNSREEWKDELRRSTITKDFKEDAENREFWQRKLSLG